jgi:hypothetical protein
MLNRRSAIRKEALHGIEGVRMQILEDAQTKTLGDGRVDAVEDRVCSGALDPFRAASGE